MLKIIAFLKDKKKYNRLRRRLISLLLEMQPADEDR